MEILFKNKTQYTNEVYQKYLDFHQKKYGLKYNMYTLLLVFLICFCIVCNIIYKNYVIIFTFFLAFITFMCWRYVSPLKKIDKEFKSEKFQREKIFIFCFYKKYFTVSDRRKRIKLSYWKIYKFFETDEFFYIYIDKNHAFLLKKDKYSIGNVDDFNTFLKRRSWRLIL